MRKQRLRKAQRITPLVCVWARTWTQVFWNQSDISSDTLCYLSLCHRARGAKIESATYHAAGKAHGLSPSLTSVVVNTDHQSLHFSHWACARSQMLRTVPIRRNRHTRWSHLVILAIAAFQSGAVHSSFPYTGKVCVCACACALTHIYCVQMHILTPTPPLTVWGKVDFTGNTIHNWEHQESLSSSPSLSDKMTAQGDGGAGSVREECVRVW